MLSSEKQPHLIGLAQEIAAILADILVKDVRTELTNLAQREHRVRDDDGDIHDFR